MLECFSQPGTESLPILTVAAADYPQWLESQSASTKAWLTAIGFVAERGRVSLIPNEKNQIALVLCILQDADDFWAVGDLPVLLPEGTYHFENPSDRLAFAWGSGAYQFNRYRWTTRNVAKLAIEVDSELHDLLESLYLLRNIINTPTEDYGPVQLARQAMELAEKHHAKVTVFEGNQLLDEGFPLTYAVGRASVHEPRMIDIRWGDPNHPAVTLIGKGVCFDSGGLNIKVGNCMRLMKKDKAGAAHVLALANLIMSQKLPLRLRVLIPAVENAVSGNSYRPGEVLVARDGTSIEISNTDAEGRLILADALIEAILEKPKLIIDMASLTGAARVALGPDLPVFFCNNEGVASELLTQSLHHKEPMWRLPLYKPYAEYLKSDIADMQNCSAVPMAGSITAALFLHYFVPPEQNWLHFDIYGWNDKRSLGRPVGGEGLGLRALFSLIKRQI